jgi:Arc/MetJ-type ribon-helix-helix transcriptional regulator
VVWDADWYAAAVATGQIAVRLPLDLLSWLDGMVERGRFPSRAAAVRAGLEALDALETQARLDAEIIDGYRRQPPSDAEHQAAVASLRHAIEEEPW